MRDAIALTEAMLSELVQAHGLPTEAGITTDEHKKDFANVLANLS